MAKQTQGFHGNDPFGSPDQPKGDGFDFDLDGMSEQELLAVGDHPGKCIDVSMSESQSSGQPMLVWDFLIDGTGKTIRYWTSLTPTAKWKVVETAEALGVHISEGSLRFNRADVIGTACIVQIEHREYEGRTRESIKKIKAAVPEEDDTPRP